MEVLLQPLALRRPRQPELQTELQAYPQGGSKSGCSLRGSAARPDSEDSSLNLYLPDLKQIRETVAGSGRGVETARSPGSQAARQQVHRHF